MPTRLVPGNFGLEDAMILSVVNALVAGVIVKETMAAYPARRVRASKQPQDVLDFERNGRPTYFDLTTVRGGRPGRSGGPAQVATRQRLTEEGYVNTESKKLGENFVDLYRPNPSGGIDYVEIDEMLKSGIPRADVRAKLKKELTHLGENDTLLFVDKTDPSKRILYRFGDDPSVVDTRTCLPARP